MAQEPIHITLEDDDAIEFVRSKVRTGEYASEAEGLLDMISEHDAEPIELDRWIREVIVPRREAFEADPTTDITIDEVEKHLVS